MVAAITVDGFDGHEVFFINGSQTTCNIPTIDVIEARYPGKGIKPVMAGALHILIVRASQAKSDVSQTLSKGVQLGGVHAAEVTRGVQ